MKNQKKAEYERSNPTRVEMNKIYFDWLRKSKFEIMIRLTGRNDHEFTKLFGKADFTWLSSGGQKSWAWKLSIDDVIVYVFSGTRGTCYEFVTDNKDEVAVGNKLIDLISNQIYPHTRMR